MSTTTKTPAQGDRHLPGDLRRATTIHPRRYQTDEETLARYVRSLREGVKFNAKPILWQDSENPDSPPLIIDGWHRVKACEKVAPKRKIACTIFTGTRQEALRMTLEINGRHGLPLTAEERTNSAWKLVREPAPAGAEHAFSKQEIARLTGTSKGTVDNMRKRWIALKADRTRIVTGDWYKDRKDDWTPPDGEEAERLAKEATAAMRQLVLDHQRLIQQDALIDAIADGMGHKLRKALVDRYTPEDCRDYGSETDAPEIEDREAQRLKHLYAEMFDPAQT